MGSNRIRKISENDRAKVASMMKAFYESPAVNSNGSEEIFQNNISTCIEGSPYASGYVFTRDDDSVCGYAMLAHSYSTEFGRPAVWIEDIYIEEDMRGTGLADEFFALVKAEYPKHIHRLEAEHDNYRAIHSYEKNEFEKMPYLEMIRFPDKK